MHIEILGSRRNLEGTVMTATQSGVPYSASSLRKDYTTYFILLHVGAIYAVRDVVGSVSTSIIWAAVGYYFLCHLSITVYKHRYRTHGAMKMKSWLRWCGVVLDAATGQSSALLWIWMHLAHHSKEDQFGDLHSPIVGCWRIPREQMTWRMKILAFLHAHMGWVLLKASYRVRPVTKFLRPENRQEYQELLWQHTNYRWLMPLMAFGVPTVIGYILGDAWGGFWVIGVLRLTLQYHFTWIVNSVGHTFGERFDGFATNFGVFNSFGSLIRLLGIVFIMVPLAVATVGEIWHAFHHLSSASWRLGRKWWQVDLGNYAIGVLAFLRQVSDRKEPEDRLRSPHAKANLGATA